MRRDTTTSATSMACRRRTTLPDYASCAQCGEYTSAALRMVEGVWLCANCADTHHQHTRCTICAQNAPSESHHVAGRRQSGLTIPVCLNCHAILSRRQYAWDARWRTEARPALYIVQGVLDVVCLWCTRSPVAGQCMGLLRLLGQAALLLLPYLRFDTLRELTNVVPMGVTP